MPWGKIFRSRNLWYVCGMYVCINYGWYFFMYFLPDFLKKQFAGQTGTLGERVVMALLAGGPLLVGVLGCVLGGILTDRHVRRTGDRKWGRRLVRRDRVRRGRGCATASRSSGRCNREHVGVRRRAWRWPGSSTT